HFSLDFGGGGTKAFLNPRRRRHYHPPLSLSLSLGPLLARRNKSEEAPPISDDGGDRRSNNEIDGTTSKPAVARRSGDMQREVSIR
ncbi:hypothetical protein LINPERPRIM_LOCUS31499, partial [Linum perenne]